jgi:hypothetical protein
MSNEKINVDEIVPCQLPFFKLSCYGCCGRNFKSKKEVEKDIEENTKEFNKISQKSLFRMLLFRDRFSKNPYDLKKSGVCSNLVNFSNCVACPLHPLINKIVSKEEYKYPNTKKDLRFGHCDVNYECETFMYWKTLSKKEKMIFIEWIGKNYDDNYIYSIENVEGILLQRYLRNK